MGVLIFVLRDYILFPAIFFLLASTPINVLFPLGAKTKLILMDVSYDKLGDGQSILCVYCSDYQNVVFGNSIGDEQGRNNI